MVRFLDVFDFGWIIGTIVVFIFGNTLIYWIYTYYLDQKKKSIYEILQKKFDLSLIFNGTFVLLVLWTWGLTGAALNATPNVNFSLGNLQFDFYLTTGCGILGLYIFFAIQTGIISPSRTALISYLIICVGIIFLAGGISTILLSNMSTQQAEESISSSSAINSSDIINMYDLLILFYGRDYFLYLYLLSVAPIIFGMFLMNIVINIGRGIFQILQKIKRTIRTKSNL
jgi:hypothetical protein